MPKECCNKTEAVHIVLESYCKILDTILDFRGLDTVCKYVGGWCNRRSRTCPSGVDAADGEAGDSWKAGESADKLDAGDNLVCSE